MIDRIDPAAARHVITVLYREMRDARFFTKVRSVKIALRFTVGCLWLCYRSAFCCVLVRPRRPAPFRVESRNTPRRDSSVV